MSQYEGGHTKRSNTAPCAINCVGIHAVAQNHRAGTIHGLTADFIVSLGFLIKHPIVEALAALAQRLLRADVGSRDKSIERHSNTDDYFTHLLLPRDATQSIAFCK